MAPLYHIAENRGRPNQLLMLVTFVGVGYSRIESKYSGSSSTSCSVIPKPANSTVFSENWNFLGLSTTPACPATSKNSITLHQCSSTLVPCNKVSSTHLASLVMWARISSSLRLYPPRLDRYPWGVLLYRYSPHGVVKVV